MVLSMTNIKDFPLSLSNSTTMDVFANLICGMANPYILSCEDADYIKDRHILIVIRKFCEKGSLKDVIHGKQSPKTPYADKYRKENGRPLKQKAVRSIGRQILEALSALNAKGIICDCLKTSNVMIDSGGLARISELELTLLGSGMPLDVCEMLMSLEVQQMNQEGGSCCEVDVLLFGLVLLEMVTGSSFHTKSFLSEVRDDFCERSGLSGSEMEPVRSILRSIFSEGSATVESLLSHPYFQGVELPCPPQRLKFQSVEKGLIKSSMATAVEYRRKVREGIERVTSARDQEREQTVKDAEEAAGLEDTVVKRRIKSGRRHSSSSLAVPGEGGRPARLSRRQSAGQSSQTSSTPPAPSQTPSPDPSQTSSSPAPPPPPPPPPPAATSTEDTNSSTVVETTVSPMTSSATAIPPQYQKLLNIGLSQEQVKHKMAADGFDPATVGW
eukprot:CAMPEP_0185032956 /NCGR_PEP_ID=MMETSP1103-20130426/21518_1 /TAXON_ID=36769 /ORGANISM="Paraphysomonas bandaiensis, Strain Caron Lab Isolate" /LENGTH=442 /DNA_ID=CAMNT_0027569057 /DNA_START=288 /DNA_END=1616 /DNA_ORIENTATION=-